MQLWVGWLDACRCWRLLRKPEIAIILRQDIFLLQPETIGALPALEELWLDVNDLIDLPPVRLLDLLSSCLRRRNVNELLSFW